MDLARRNDLAPSIEGRDMRKLAKVTFGAFLLTGAMSAAMIAPANARVYVGGGPYGPLLGRLLLW